MPRRLLSAALLSFALVAACASPAPRPGAVDWNRYYDTAETHAILRAYAARHPGLTELFSIGRSYLGEELLVMQVTNEATGPAEHKPALYVDGNIHSGELTGSAVTLYLMAHLLDRYGTDPEVTDLVDTRVFYLRPKFNPDGADLALTQDQPIRSSVRPWDEDGDGALDEDPPQDLDGDGFITQMRIRDPDGATKASADDPRLMVMRGRNDGEGTFYRIESEGLDDDGDGSFNEDGIGGLDLNRNFPRNWELEFRQRGAGPFPLSEPETYAAVKFLDEHDNVMGIVHGHTSGGFVYRLPSASNPELFDRDDLELIVMLGEEYTRTTGRPVRPSSTHPTQHRYGTLISWGYWDQGVIGWVPEYWPGLAADFEGSAAERELTRLRIDDEQLGGRWFAEWTPFDHPQLGRVEIGGWRSRFVRQNPPPEMLEAECALQIPWILYLARQSPLVRASAPQVAALGGGRSRIEVAVENTGFLPTNLTQRGLEARVVAPVIAELELRSAGIEAGSRREDLGHLAGSHRAEDDERSSRATAAWTVRALGPGAAARVTVRSEKGGTVVSDWVRLRP